MTPPAAADRSAPLRWGVLGVANIAVKQVIPALQSSPRARVEAIASRDPAKAEAAARALGIPRAHDSYEALLADPAVDAIYNPLTFTDPFGLCPYTGDHTTNVDDCPKGELRDAFLLLRDKGGQEGASTIRLVAANQASVRLLTQSSLDAQCKPREGHATGCNGGGVISMLAGQSTVDNASRLTHEATHFMNRADEEPLAWRRALTVWRRFESSLPAAAMQGSWYQQYDTKCKNGATAPTYCP